MSLHGHVPPEPDLVQLLTPEGIRVEHPDFPLSITDDELKSLYRDLILVRRFDAEGTALQRQGELGLWASCLGQEAAQVGAGRAMGVARDGAVGTGDLSRDTAVLAFFGDGASSQGDVNEAFIWAAAGNLPVVFYCQNNQWAISEPLERQTRV